MSKNKARDQDCKKNRSSKKWEPPSDSEEYKSKHEMSLATMVRLRAPWLRSREPHEIKTI